MHEKIANIRPTNITDKIGLVEIDDQTRILDNAEFLHGLGWSPFKPVLGIRSHDINRITAINRTPAEDWASRAVTTAYYSLELADHGLKTPSEATRLLNATAKKEGELDQRVIDSFLRACVVEDLLWKSLASYPGTTGQSEAKSSTRLLTIENNGALLALNKMRTSRDSNLRISRDNGLLAETILRGMMAIWQEKVINRQTRKFSLPDGVE